MDQCKSIVQKLGQAAVESPIHRGFRGDNIDRIFIKDDERLLLDITYAGVSRAANGKEQMCSFEKAGPREKLYFNPAATKAAIVTCGGICPGLNDVIRAIVMTLHYRYGVRDILGVRNGYQGMVKKSRLEPVRLNETMVDHINHTGGTILGTSRGEQRVEEMVDFLMERNINQLFVIGGDGTMRGAIKISEEARRRDAKISVIGIPKTVDNDILYIDRSFGFITASSIACDIVETAHNEAKSQINGVGLVKLMGRSSGFITCLAALASGNANFVLIPEVPFALEGAKGFLSALENRLLSRSHAVILVAEGAGQEHIATGAQEKDASGNIKFNDVGIYLRDKINSYFKEKNIEINLKYIDPSYIVRAVGTTSVDSVYCYTLGKNAVHAAMSGRTELVVGMVHNEYVHIPMKIITSGRKKVDPRGELWFSVLESTGQCAQYL